MVLRGKRIILRKFKKDDISEYLKVTDDFSIKRYVPFACPINLDEATKLIENYSERDFENDFYFVIEHTRTGKIIGGLLVYKDSSNNLDVSYFISQDFRGDGFCLEALRVFINYISKNTNYKFLKFSIRNKNKASQKIMEKISAKKVGQDKKMNFYEYQIKSAK